MDSSNIKFLLDTNIIIQSEDACIIQEKFSDFVNKCHQYSIPCFINDGSKDDINRDKNIQRKDIILSKLKKYPCLDKIDYPSKEVLAQKYGEIKKDNDLVDVQLLHCLEINAVNFLVTEDIGIHKRVASKHELAKRVFNIVEILDWINQTFASKSIDLPYIQSKKCYNIDTNQPLFLTLKKDYSDFDDWFQKCQNEHRDAWVIEKEDQIIALIIWKQDTGEGFQRDIKNMNNLNIEDQSKVLKICTFKVSENERGSKLGELLLKQCLWYAADNNFDWVYLTSFEKQDYLIDFLQEYGFENIGSNDNDELILCKQNIKQQLVLNNLTPFEFHKKFYPKYYDEENIQKFIVPIDSKFHEKLFPEYSEKIQISLFDNNSIEDDNVSIIAGNTIRKVYVSGAQTNQPKIGDLVFFYMSKDSNYKLSQSITVVGVISDFKKCGDLDHLLRLTGKRTVYSKTELQDYLDKSSKGLKVMDFYIAGHIINNDNNPLKLSDGNIEIPQSMAIIKANQYNKLKEKMKIIHGKHIS